MPSFESAIAITSISLWEVGSIRNSVQGSVVKKLVSVFSYVCLITAFGLIRVVYHSGLTSRGKVESEKVHINDYSEQVQITNAL